MRNEGTARVLVIHSSPDLGRSVSRALTARVVSRLLERYPNAEVRVRDLVEMPLPHFGATQVAAAYQSPEARTPADSQALALSDRLCAELLESDIIVIGSPMWNFSVPSALKAWVDHIARAGLTFRYGPQGPEGMLRPDIQVIVVESMGGMYAETELAPRNHVGPWLKQVFRFLGVARVEILSAQGTALGNPGRVIAAAEVEIDSLFGAQ